MTIDFEVRMQSPFHLRVAGFGFQEGRLHHSRQSSDQRGVDRRECTSDVPNSCVMAHRSELTAELRNDLLQSLRLKHGDGLGQRTERTAFTAQFLLDLLQFAGLLQCAQGSDDGIEQKEQDQHAVLIKVKLSIGSLVSLATDVVQTLKQRIQLVEILQPRDVLLTDVGLLVRSLRHAKNNAAA
jgi:hypothetical protein